MLQSFLRSAWLIFVLILLILMLVFAGALVRSGSDEIHGVEQNVAYNLQLIIGGLPLYSPPDMPPYNIVQYMPGYYGLIDHLAGLFSIDAHNIQGIYLLSRVVAAIFGLGVAILVWLSCLRFGLNGKAALGCLLLAVILPMPWFVLVRPDSMMSFFDFFAISLFLIYLENPKSSPALLFTIGFSLGIAFFAKQTAIVVIGLILVFPFYQQSIKDRLWILLGLGLSLGLMTFLLSEYFSLFPLDNNPFYMNTVEGVTNRVNLALSNQLLYNIYFNRYRPFFLIPLVLTIFVVAAFLRELGKSEGSKLKALWESLAKGDKRFGFLFMAFWWMTIAALFMGFKDGAAMNYMIESMLLAVMLIAYYMSKNPQVIALLQKTEFQIAAALVVMTIAFSISVDHITRYAGDLLKEAPYEKWQETISLLDAEFAAHPESAFIYFPKDVFDRWLNFYYYDRAWFTSREIFVQAFFDISTVRAYLDDGTIRFLVTDKVPFPAEIFGFTDFQDYFELWRETDTHLIYLNRNSE
jgi:hypothetical protein